MITATELDAHVRRVYAEIARDWYSTHQTWSPATVRVEVLDDHSYYNHAWNEIAIRILEGNLDTPTVLDVPDVADERRWPVWMAYLVHEMLHEYEKKVIVSPTPAGAQLHASHPHPFWEPPEDHGPLYYSAICDRAPYFSLSPRELLGAI